MSKFLFLSIILSSITGFTCSDFTGIYIAPFDPNVSVSLSQDKCNSITQVVSNGYTELIYLDGRVVKRDHNPDVDIIMSESCFINNDLITCVGTQIADGIAEEVSREYRLLENGDFSAKQIAGEKVSNTIFMKK